VALTEALPTEQFPLEKRYNDSSKHDVHLFVIDEQEQQEEQRKCLSIVTEYDYDANGDDSADTMAP
jgi:hypothetical protein